METEVDLLSPMMQQWHLCKKGCSDCLLLFRMGDFYEAFYEDAPILAKELELTLTKRQQVPMSGIPAHTSEGYIDKLVGKGYKVAIAEQVETSGSAKGLLKREVVRVVSPGTLMQSQLLQEKSHNFFASVTEGASRFGLSFVDLSTGELFASEWDTWPHLLNELYRIQPKELLLSHPFHTKHASPLEELRLSTNCLISQEEEWMFDLARSTDFLLRHLGLHQLDGLGLDRMPCATKATGGLLLYLQNRLSLPIAHIRSVKTYLSSAYMMIDKTTQRNLEIYTPLREGGASHTLLSILDETLTPMGGRLLQNWLKQPLLSVDAIVQRQDAIAYFLQHPSSLSGMRHHLGPIRDIDRLMGRIQTNFCSPRDLQALGFSLEPVEQIQNLFAAFSLPPLLQNALSKLDPLLPLQDLLQRALVDSPPARVGEGPLFRRGFSLELDELLALSENSTDWMARYQTLLREETGIKTLKVSFNKIFGYYIEVSRGQAERMPPQFTKKQTLVHSERFITPELKEYENRIFSAQERIFLLEKQLLEELRQQILHHLPALLENARSLALLDGIASLSCIAAQREYCRPAVDETDILCIEEGRHPVIEATCLKERFIPNDTRLGGQEARMLLITGPNMAGKSTYLRQVALITLMAQIGSFVPAKKASIGLVDQLFTRIGASDDLARGQSTFMVEMSETAYILHHATARSLIILDEIGRGTGTNDGISLAWAVAEFLLKDQQNSPKTLFATHYWELTQLEEKEIGVQNYHMAVYEEAGGIHFLRKIVRGGTDRSYGIHVARLAGLPHSVIERATELLQWAEKSTPKQTTFNPPRFNPPRPRTKTSLLPTAVQLTLFEQM